MLGESIRFESFYVCLNREGVKSPPLYYRGCETRVLVDWSEKGPREVPNADRYNGSIPPSP